MCAVRAFKLLKCEVPHCDLNDLQAQHNFPLPVFHQYAVYIVYIL